MSNSICICCKKEIDQKDELAAVLKDKKMVCGSCASKVIILYPKDITWVSEMWESEDIYRNEIDESPMWIDSLSDLKSSGIVIEEFGIRSSTIDPGCAGYQTEICFFGKPVSVSPGDLIVKE